MKGLIQEIREQPEHIRHIFMWVLVVITFSVVGFAWFRSTQKRFVALMNPEAAQEARALALDGRAQRAVAEKTKVQGLSPFATITNSWKDLSANVYELFAGKRLDVNIRNGNPAPNESLLLPQKLPVAGNK